MAVVIPWTFGGLSGRVPASRLDDDFTALANAITSLQLSTTLLYVNGLVNITNSAAAVEVASLSLPGGTLGTLRSVVVRVVIEFTNTVGVAHAANIVVLFGGVPLPTLFVTCPTGGMTTVWVESEIVANGTQVDQLGYVRQFRSTGAGVQTATIDQGMDTSLGVDSTLSQPVKVVVQLDTASANFSANIWNTRMLLS